VSRRAVWLAVKAGGGIRPVAALPTATPGVFVWRDRRGLPCDPEDCDHHWTHGQDYLACPDEGWAWRVALACGMHVTAAADALDRLDSARQLAAALGRWPVDWTTTEAQLRAYTFTQHAQDHLRWWLRDALLMEHTSRRGHMPCPTCPPLPDIDAPIRRALWSPR
jgi:hypothetical protein